MSKSKKMRRIIKAAKMGKPYAMFALGIEYQLGKHLPKDTEKACLWITQAANCGYADAAQWLKDYYFDDNAAVQAES